MRSKTFRVQHGPGKTGHDRRGDGIVAPTVTYEAPGLPAGSSNLRPWENILANVVGFGKDTVGGAGAELYHVTNLNDSGVGSLRAGAESTTPYWIVFDVSGTITQSTVLKIRSNKTIDGRGANVLISSSGMEIGVWSVSDFVTDNVIIHNITFEEITSNGGVIIGGAASNIWIDHCTFHDATDELLFVGSDIGSAFPNGDIAPYGITISWCKWPTTTGGGGGGEAPGYGDKAVLISDPSSTQDADMTITLHHNHYQATYVRHPLCRWGKIHAFNNYLDRNVLGVQAGLNVQFYSENDIYKKHAGGVALMLDSDIGGIEPGPSLYVKCIGEYLLSGALVEERTPESIFNPSASYSYTAETADDTLLAAVEAGSGWQDVELP